MEIWTEWKVAGEGPVFLHGMVRSVELVVPEGERSKFDGPLRPDQAVISILVAFS